MDIQRIVEMFDVKEHYISHREIHSGLINQTYLVTIADDKYHVRKVILQRINTTVFKNPQEVMQNIIGVTGHIKNFLLEHEGTYERRVLDFIMSKTGESYVDDPKLGFWRAYYFVDNSVAYDQIPSSTQFYQAGKAFGAFQRQLADYDAKSLFETIPNFHHTVDRVRQFREAIDNNIAGRRDNVMPEIEFFLRRTEEAGTIIHALENGEIPYRVTHNDTKINNVLFDVNSDNAICVIDLDTIMPGSSLYDFGDGIRSGASTAAEDEPDLDKVHMDIEMYDKFTKGFIKGTHNLLTPREIELLPLGAKIMTFECAIRFLSDYLNGDVYFNTTSPNQNLLRTRTQIKLIVDMEREFDRMQEIALAYGKKYAERYANEP